jgi:hypothetical protein
VCEMQMSKLPLPSYPLLCVYQTRSGCFYADFLAFPGSIVNTLASPEELAASASIGRVGLGLPPRPPTVGTSSQQVVPGLESGPCK